MVIALRRLRKEAHRSEARITCHTFAECGARPASDVKHCATWLQLSLPHSRCVLRHGGVQTGVVAHADG